MVLGRFTHMRRLYIAIVSMGITLATVFVLSSTAGATVEVPGLDLCHTGLGCHPGPVGETYLNYRSVCSVEDCNFVSAADWEQIGVGVTPTRSMLKVDYSQDGQTFGGGLSMPELWSYWEAFGIDGVYLSSESLISRNKSAVESTVLAHRAVIAESITHDGSYIGTDKYKAGTEVMVVDGYTPKGPIAVYQGRTIQMTWAQWNSQIRSVWEILVSRRPPVTAPTTTPLPTSTSLPTATLSLSPAAVPSTGLTVTLSFSSQNATSCELSSVPTLWTAGSVIVNCNGSYQINVAPALVEQQWIFTLTASDGAGQNATATQTLIQAAPSASAQNPSNNWSGYVVPSSSSLITDAQADFTVPTLNCTDVPDGQTWIWVGIGGEQWATGGSSGSLLQTGVNTSCIDGIQQDIGWWEVVPATPNYAQNFTNFPISPGDEIQASVFQETNGVWETLLNDLNTGLSALMVTGQSWGVGPTTTGSINYTIQGSAVGINYSGAYTAEWIVEDPTNTSTQSLDPFANFGSVNFTDLESSFKTWSLTPDETWAIVQSGDTLASPSVTTADAFTVAYTGQ